PLVTTLFQYGAFSVADTLATREAVVAYSVGLVGLILVKVLAPGFYARQDIRTPVRIAIVTLLATQALNAVLIWPLRHAGLALAISLGACFNAGSLFWLLRRRGVFAPQPGWAPFMLKLALAVAMMAVVIWLAAGDAALWLAASASYRVVRLTCVIAVGATTYFVALWALGFRLRDFNQRAAE
ncbi:MAG: murein biosynthesis integral membrane protein MurJ, partial [Burkholderiales bacterium]